MPSARRTDAFHLFTFRGIDVFVHWTWFVAAVFLVRTPVGHYRDNAWLWSLLEYASLFVLVTLHEFGHALACQQVGGEAHEIVLWPLGGVAFVSPPQRPGATLWSIAAGPLVNAILAPVLWALVVAMNLTGWYTELPNLYAMAQAILTIDLVLLFFNLVPIYPLDGGQILRSLLWFAIGRARSLLVASILGFAGVGVLIVFAYLRMDWWLGLITLFIFLNCWTGLRQALILARMDRTPLRYHAPSPDSTPLRFGYACPSCGAAPRVGKFWACGHCRTAFDTFETRAQCPSCGATFDTTCCLACGASHPLAEWGSGG